MCLSITHSHDPKAEVQAKQKYEIFFESEKCHIHLTIGTRQATAELKFFLGQCLSQLIFNVASTEQREVTCYGTERCEILF